MTLQNGQIKQKQAIRNILTAVFCVVTSMGCSSGQIEPLAELPKVPVYAEIPHPVGLEYADLLAVFTDPKAPMPDTLASCDSDFQKLKKATLSRDELLDGTRELVRSDPSKYHWCYYSKVFLLDKKLKEMTYVDEKQKLILETFLFLTPVARAFQSEFQDSRYYRWAVGRYQRYSEMAFYRKVEPTASANAELAGASSPLGNQRMIPQDSDRGILDKYGILAPVAPSPTSLAAPSSLSAPKDAKVHVEKDLLGKPIERKPASSANAIEADDVQSIPKP